MQQDPFVVPRQAFFDSVHTVVVTSVSVLGEIEVADTTLSLIERLIAERLAEAGLSVVPATEYMEIWDRISEEAGGFYDRYTGERDEPKFQDAADSLMSELSTRFDPDALLYPEIWEVQVPFSQGDARWGGAARMVSGGRGYSGEVLAATLYVVVQDTAGNELYTREAGIQVLEYMSNGQLTPLPDERILSDTTWIRVAVRRALQPLVIGRPDATPADSIGVDSISPSWWLPVSRRRPPRPPTASWHRRH